METLTTRQIEDFNNPLAFARAREARIGQSVIGSVENRPIRTRDIEQSYGLVTGAEKRLETLEGNLKTMLDLALSGTSARGNQRRIEEIYGKLRSLSAGFDQIIDAVVFNGRPVFAGDSVYLNLGNGVAPIDLETSRLLTYGDHGLGLSNPEPMASASIGYAVDDRIVNDAYDIIGLDISGAEYISGQNVARELETGTYKVKIRYAGADSQVDLLTPTGGLIESRAGVDLSGSGREWVDFDVGVRLTFEKESLFSSFDKWDFEASGPAHLSATLEYERLEGHVLRTSEAVPENRIDFKLNASLVDSGGVLSVSNPGFAPVSQEATVLENGVYTLNVEYRGDRSVIRLTDALGRLRGFQYGVDLTGTDARSIDLKNGLVFTITNTGFTREGSTLSMPVEYQRKRPPLEDFDFREYATRLEKAVDVVVEQRKVIEEARKRIEEVNRLRNLASTSAIPNQAALAASGALNVLTGKHGLNTSPFDPALTQARIQTLGTQLFSTTTALPAQANLSPEALARLELARGNWLTDFA